MIKGKVWQPGGYDMSLRKKMEAFCAERKVGDSDAFDVLVDFVSWAEKRDEAQEVIDA